MTLEIWRGLAIAIYISGLLMAFVTAAGSRVDDDGELAPERLSWLQLVPRILVWPLIPLLFIPGYVFRKKSEK